MTSLGDLGERICILGPSGSGKSTLAKAISESRGMPAIYLDQLRHEPGSAWVTRPDDEFALLHDEAIEDESWVIDGAYSALLPQRLARATGLIVLDCSTAASLWRYVRRNREPHARVGGLGTVDSVNWAMIRYILGPTRANRRRYRAVFEESGMPKVFLPNRRAIERFGSGLWPESPPKWH